MAITTESRTNDATTLSHMLFSTLVRQVTTCGSIITNASCLIVGLWLELDLASCLVSSGYALVCVVTDRDRRDTIKQWLQHTLLSGRCRRVGTRLTQDIRRPHRVSA